VSAHFSLSEELANYKAMKVPPAGSNPLKFWKKHATVHPVMSATSRRVLCISTGSVTDIRSRLNEDTVEAIEVLHWWKRAGLISCWKHWTRNAVYIWCRNDVITDDSDDDEDDNDNNNNK